MSWKAFRKFKSCRFGELKKKNCEKTRWDVNCVCLSIQPLSFFVNFGISKYLKVGTRHNNIGFWMARLFRCHFLIVSFILSLNTLDDKETSLFHWPFPFYSFGSFLWCYALILSAFVKIRMKIKIWPWNNTLR